MEIRCVEIPEGVEEERKEGELKRKREERKKEKRQGVRGRESGREVGRVGERDINLNIWRHAINDTLSQNPKWPINSYIKKRVASAIHRSIKNR